MGRVLNWAPAGVTGLVPAQVIEEQAICLLTRGGGYASCRVATGHKNSDLSRRLFHTLVDIHNRGGSVFPRNVPAARSRVSRGRACTFSHSKPWQKEAALPTTTVYSNLKWIISKHCKSERSQPVFWSVIAPHTSSAGVVGTTECRSLQNDK